MTISLFVGTLFESSIPASAGMTALLLIVTPAKAGVQQRLQKRSDHSMIHPFATTREHVKENQPWPRH